MDIGATDERTCSYLIGIPELRLYWERFWRLVQIRMFRDMSSGCLVRKLSRGHFCGTLRSLYSYSHFYTGYTSGV